MSRSSFPCRDSVRFTSHRTCDGGCCRSTTNTTEEDDMTEKAAARPIGRIAVGLVAAALLVLAACGSDSDGASSTTTAPADSGAYDPALATEVVAHYADGVYNSYNVSLDVGHGDADGDRRLRGGAERGHPAGGQGRVAGGSARLRPHRGVPLLRRPDRQRGRRTRGTDQRAGPSTRPTSTTSRVRPRAASSTTWRPSPRSPPRR